MYDELRIGLTAALLLISVYTDHRSGKILNKVTFPALAIGLVLSLLFGGPGGLLKSLLGMGLALLLFIIPFVLGMVGAGDIKLMMAVGALNGAYGPMIVFWGFLYGSVCGGLMSVIVMISRGTFIRVMKGIYLFLTSIFLKVSLMKVDRQETGTLLGVRSSDRAFPYSLAIAAGVVLAMLYMPVRLGM